MRKLREKETLRPERGQILVIARDWRSGVDVPQAPLLVLDENDIEAYGASSLNDLLDQLGPHTGSGRGRGSGRPVTLLNGRRISNFREIRELPPEAIRRVEVLPEEVALRFGYPADQRVVNFILKDRFAGKTASARHAASTQGGTADTALAAGLQKIDGPNLLNVSGKINRTTLLTEAERGLVQPSTTVPNVAGDPDPARYRSLIAANRDFAVDATWSTAVGRGARAASLTLSGGATRSRTRGLEGLDTFQLIAPGGQQARRTLPGPLTRHLDVRSYTAGAALYKALGGWDLSATLDGSHSRTVTRVDRRRDTSNLVRAAAAGVFPVDAALPGLPPHSVDRAKARGTGLTSLLTLTGSPFSLRAGEASMTLKAGFAYSRSDSRHSLVPGVTLGRRDVSAGASLGVPIAKRDNGGLGAVGDVTIDLSAGVNRLSDFGTLTDWSAGVTWAPTGRLTMQASYYVDEAAPSLQALGSPVLVTNNVSVFDFSSSQTALVTITQGGNPALKRETQRDIKLSANWNAPILKNSNIIVEYFRNRSKNVTQSFPLLTPDIEAAFPDRVERDENDDRLLSIDRRPVTFSAMTSSRLRSGIYVSGAIPVRESGLRAAASAKADRPTPNAVQRPGRWDFSLFHTAELTNRVRIGPQTPVLNSLKGDAVTDGGVPRHRLELSGGVLYRGFGLRIDGDWTSPAKVRSGPAQGQPRLRFGSIARFDLRAFVSFDQQTKFVDRVPLLRRSHLTLKAENLFNARQRVTDASGRVPLSHQSAYRDPRGRVLSIEFRKLFG